MGESGMYMWVYGCIYVGMCVYVYICLCVCVCEIVSLFSLVHIKEYLLLIRKSSP